MQRRIKQALEHDLFEKFLGAEKEGKKHYAETTHDSQGVANAFTIGVKRDEKNKSYVFFRDL